MNLLFSREQSAASFTLVPLQFGGGQIFTLWAKVELDADETQLIEKYRFRDALLIGDDWIATLRKAARTSVLFGFVIWFALAFILQFSWSASATLAFLATIVITGVYYNEIREHIYVRDLVHGRKFRCFSIVELIHKEEHLKVLTLYLRQVLESAKHWGGNEAVEIPALTPEEARRLVLKLT